MKKLSWSFLLGVPARWRVSWAWDPAVKGQFRLDWWWSGTWEGPEEKGSKKQALVHVSINEPRDQEGAGRAAGSSPGKDVSEETEPSRGHKDGGGVLGDLHGGDFSGMVRADVAQTEQGSDVAVPHHSRTNPRRSCPPP